jgi:hypothetical protein
MVRLLDPFSGYLLAVGNSMIHIGLLVGILTLTYEDPCTAAEYETAKILLIASHIVVLILSIVSHFLSKTKYFVMLADMMDVVCLFFYQGTIFFTQSQFFKSENICKFDSTELHYWFLTEIVIFYSLILSAIVYLLFAAVFSFKNSILLDEAKRKSTDFITWSLGVYRYFGMFLSLFIVSTLLYTLEEAYECFKHDNLIDPMQSLIATHLA